MFLMQRYLGSDDEDAPISNYSTEKENDSSEKNEKSSSRKRKIVHNSELLNYNSNNNNDDAVELDSKAKTSKRNSLSCQSFPENSVDKVSDESGSSHIRKKRKKDFNEDSSYSEPKKSNEKINKKQIHTKQNLDHEKTLFSSPKKKKKEKNSDEAAVHDAVHTNYKETTEKEDGKEKNNSSDSKPESSLIKKKHKKKESKRKELEEPIQESIESKDVNNTSMNFLPIGQIKQKADENIKAVLPKWLSNPTVIEVDLKGKEIPIAELNYLDDNTKQNLLKADIKFLFPVQLSVIPWLLQNKARQISIPPSDLCVSAPTGSGKTLAFVLPIVQSLKNRLVCAVRALVVLPVSELAKQVYKVFELFIQGTDLKVVLLTGQKSFIAEQNALIDMRSHKSQSLVDVIVTTPGRILDHINRTKGFTLQSLRYLVIDEADRMMEEIQQGWLKQIEDAVYTDCQKSCICFNLENDRISAMPTTACDFSCAKQPLQKLLYSATLSHDPEKLHSLSLYRPKLFTALSTPLEVEGNWIGKCTIPGSLEAFHAICEDTIKPMVLCHLIKMQKHKKVLCFTDTVERAQRLHIVLEEMGILQVREISSFNRQVQRKIVLGQFSCGTVNVLVCSDLVARGIDIEDVDCVISYDAPQNIKTYVHRIGRTARAGKDGTSITLVSSGEFPAFKKMVLSAGMSIPKKINVDSEDLKEYVSSFQKALQAADVKLKKIKSVAQQRKHNRRKKNLKTL
ncbi:ATP-dependent RNA helicase DDX51-like [Uloborus diversus]|uniref:ATP-dependent RNA helicase DDX51-like n=1 Tax=Uloborus diversus TaxID=327109 RepID=UPI0024096AE8|nr:ATP-dependent RNA helicase DDX51-like [Uloborus diversus]